MRKLIGAAAAGCGIALAAWSAPEAEAVGDRGYIVITDDHGKNWRRAKSPAAPLLTAVDFLDDQLGIAVGHDSVILASRDGGETWTQQFSAPAEKRPLLDVLFVKKDFAVAVGAYGAYYDSTDGGNTWNARKITTDDKHFNAIIELGEGHLLIFGEAGTLLSSNDWGKTWVPLASPYKGSFFGALVTESGAVVAFGLRGRIYRSTDKGRSWKQVDNPSTAALIGGEKLPDGSLVLAGAAGTALVSRDQGLSFVPITTSTTRAFAKPILGAQDKLLLLGEAGAREVAFPMARSPER